jgi:hypothetical protein
MKALGLREPALDLRHRMIDLAHLVHQKTKTRRGFPCGGFVE